MDIGHYNNINMWNRRAPLCVWLLAVAGLSMAGQQDVKYIPLEGRLELRFDWTPTTVTLFKTVPQVEQAAVVAEWHWASPAKDVVYGTYEGRTELEKGTGVVIKNVTKEDSGTYFMVFNSNRRSELYKFEVINRVPKPSVAIKLPCSSPQSTICSLVCEGNFTDSGPVTIRWKKDEGEWMESDSGQNWTITNNEKWKKVEKVFCEMKNPLSVEQSDPCDNPLYIKDNDTPVGGIIGGIIVALILAVGLVLGVTYRDHIKRMLTTCELWPVDDPKAASTTDGSSPINENEVLLPGSTPGSQEVVIILYCPDVMELIDTIMSRATSLYPLCEEVKANKTRCQRLVQRVKGLEQLVGEMKQKGAGQNPATVKEALCELKTTLEDAAEVVKKYTSDSFHEHMWKDNKHRDEFRSLNDHLNNAFQKLCLNVQLDQNLQTKLLNLFNRDEDEKDRKEDCAELQKIMELIDAIMSIATSLYFHCKEVKGNKKQCQRLARCVKGLEDLVGEIKQKGAGQNSDDVEKALRDLKKTLESATEVVVKYTSASFHKHVFKDYNDNEFGSLNSRLYDSFKVLSKALYVDHNHELYKLFNKDSQAENEAGRMEDHAELKRIMELIDDISKSKETTISPLRQDAANNKKRRKCLVQHEKVLEEQVEAIKEKGPGQNSAQVEEALCELKTTLRSPGTAAFVKKKKKGFDTKLTKYSKEYDILNDSLSNALNKLSRALSVDQ